MLVYCMLVCTGWVPQMNFVVACQLSGAASVHFA